MASLVFFYIPNLYASAASGPPSSLLEQDRKVTHPIMQNAQGPTDAQMMQDAQRNPSYTNVVMLEAHVPLPFGFKPRIFGASGVYVGKKSVLTAAHCLDPWIWGGKLRVDLYVVVERQGPTFKTRYKVTDCKVHPQWRSSAEMQNDIAILQLSEEIQTLKGLEPFYGIPKTDPVLDLTPEKIKLIQRTMSILGDDLNNVIAMNDHNLPAQELKKLKEKDESLKSEKENCEKRIHAIDEQIARVKAFNGQKIVEIGYGTNGILGAVFSYNDGRKRLTESLLMDFVSCSSTNLPTNTALAFSRSSVGMGLDPETFTPKRRALLPLEGGSRYGMSGGAVLWVDKDNQERFMGIAGSGHYDVILPRGSGKITSWMRDKYTDYLGKYISALGIPAPFLNPKVGDGYYSLLLVYHQDWIEKTRKEFDQ